MPEIPDVELYLHAFNTHIVGKTLNNSLVKSPFLLRTYEPAIDSFFGNVVESVFRIGKRIVWQFSNSRYFVFHLMIAGRFHWRKPLTSPRGKNDLAAFHFANGTLMLTEASPKKRASLHIVERHERLAQFDKGGLEIQKISENQFAKRLHSANRTLKRALTDPSIFSGIGNAYSDEILLDARLSPFQRASKLDDNSTSRLYVSCRRILTQWTNVLIEETEGKFPEKVTAFRKDMIAHGKFGQPCLNCGNNIQRVVFADNEMNYCPGCQTNGRILADRSLSRLLKDDWPRSIEELEQ